MCCIRDDYYVFSYFHIFMSIFTAPTAAPTGMEAVLLNTTAVYLKWQPPSVEYLNGNLRNYHVIIRGYDANNISKVLTNMTVDGNSPKLMLTNLTAGVTYSVSVAASTKVGYGPYSSPSILRLDPSTNKLDQGYVRFVRNMFNCILTCQL